MTARVIVPATDEGRPDSIYTWAFEAQGGDSWGGTLVADSTLFAPGDRIAGAQGVYTILMREERAADLSPLGLEDGQVFLEWYWHRASGQFLPTRNGPGIAAGLLGLGSELDLAWTGAAWASFGMGGQLQAGVIKDPATARFAWTFEANTGDRWSGLLFDRAEAHDAGKIVPTAQGVYRITSEEALGTGSDIAAGTVRLTGTYFDNASGFRFSVQGADGITTHSAGGFGSELGLAWNGGAWMPFGLDGTLQIDAPLAMRPLYRGFGYEAGGWMSQDAYPRMLADVNGDRRADLVGFGNAGVWVAPAAPGGFEPARLLLGEYGYVAGGWASHDAFPRMLGDVNGDGRADIVGFGLAGVWVAFSTTSGFEPSRLVLGEFGYIAGGWASQSVFPRTLADVNGDGRADIVGFGLGGVWVAMANGAGGFHSARLMLEGFGYIAGGWVSQELYPRMLADVNGDRRADVVGFGNAGVWVATANAAGGFDPARLVLGEFGYVAGGWASQDRYPRMLADVTGDGRADVVGFGNAGVWVAPGDPGGGLGPGRLVMSAFGYEAGGWTSQMVVPRTVADINGDGRGDVVGFGIAGVWAELLGPW